MFDTNKFDIQDFVEKLNSKFDSIPLVTEQELNSEFPFLDTLSKKESRTAQNKLESDICRKGRYR